MKYIIIAINKALITLSCTPLVSTICSVRGLSVIIVNNHNIVRLKRVELVKIVSEGMKGNDLGGKLVNRHFINHNRL
jgi:hypothetical protein